MGARGAKGSAIMGFIPPYLIIRNGFRGSTLQCSFLKLLLFILLGDREVWQIERSLKDFAVPSPFNVLSSPDEDKRFFVPRSALNTKSKDTVTVHWSHQWYKMVVKKRRSDARPGLLTHSIIMMVAIFGYSSLVYLPKVSCDENSMGTCPSVCTCSQKMVDCSRKSLKSFPSSLPSTTLIL